MAYVQLRPGVESRRFEVQRGVRQGDPLSPVLFNLLLTQVLKEVDPVWQRRGYGTNVGQMITGRRLTHVAFADDMTLISRSWLSLKRMVITLREALRYRGLELHPSKCKAQTNDSSWRRRGKVQILPDFALDVLDDGECLDQIRGGKNGPPLCCIPLRLCPVMWAPGGALALAPRCHPFALVRSPPKH